MSESKGLTIGVDPGADGAMVALNEYGEIEDAIRFKGKDHSFHAAGDWLNGWARQGIEKVYVEKQFVRTGVSMQGVLINFGRLLECIDRGLGYPKKLDSMVIKVAANSWQAKVVTPMLKTMTLEAPAVDSKEKAATVAIKLFGLDACNTWLTNASHTFHDGLIDAALIAWYGLKEAQ